MALQARQAARRARATLLFAGISWFVINHQLGECTTSGTCLETQCCSNPQERCYQKVRAPRHAPGCLSTLLATTT